MSDIPADLDIPTQSLLGYSPVLPDIDELFSQLPDIPDTVSTTTEDGSAANLLPMPSTSRANGTSKRFGPLVSATQVTALQKAAVPANTKRNTNWAANVWMEWAANRKLQCPTEWPPHRVP